MSGYLAGTIYGASYNGPLPSGGGGQPGQRLMLPNGRDLTYVQNNPSGATLQKNVSLQMINNTYQVNVTPATANTAPFHGINDNVTSTVVVSNYFFMTERGLVQVNVASGVAVDTIVNSSGTTAGTLIAGAASAICQPTHVTTMAASGGGGVTACYMK